LCCVPHSSLSASAQFPHSRWSSKNRRLPSLPLWCPEPSAAEAAHPVFHSLP
jgi:hypothetical protein